MVKDEHIFDNSNCWSFSLVEHTLNLNTHYYAFSTNSINKNRLLFRGGNVGGSSPEEQKIRIALAQIHLKASAIFVFHTTRFE